MYYRVVGGIKVVDYQINCYKHRWILDEVQGAVNQVFWKLTDLDRLQNDILNYVGAYLAQDETNERNKMFVRKLIYRKLNSSLKRNQKEHTIHFANLGIEDDSGELIEYEPVDVLANVDSALEIKETITLLAKDDRRRELILNAWANGITNDTELSDTLAGVLGGQSRSHCKFIQRFRIECRSVLTAAI